MGPASTGSPLTRFSAYSVVLDVARDDSERHYQANQFLQYGQQPTTLQTVLVSRTQGEQDILRAEMQAIICIMLQAKTGCVHTDSQAAIHLLTCALQATQLIHIAHLEHFDLLLPVWQARAAIHVTLHKIKAHADPAMQPDLLQTYHTLGNIHADAAAVAACKQLLPDFVQDLQRAHANMKHMQHTLQQVYQLHLRLRDVRLKSATLPQPSQQPTDLAIQQAYSDWYATAPLPVPVPVDERFFDLSAWGSEATSAMACWLTLLVWPPDDSGPLGRSTGFTWTEMAVAFMLWWKRYLPVLRRDAQGRELVTLVANVDEAREHGLTLQELTRSALRLLDHTCALSVQQLVPRIQRKRCASLKVLGATHQYAMGWARRPRVPMQQDMVTLLVTLFEQHQGSKLLMLPELACSTTTMRVLAGTFDHRMQGATRAMHLARRCRNEAAVVDD